jgi:hypothetical protein
MPKVCYDANRVASPMVSSAGNIGKQSGCFLVITTFFFK